jgi:hypothetical protein
MPERAKGFAMFDWTLKIKMDGQWESCRYSTQLLAENAYESVLKDYGKRISQAQLIARDGTVLLLGMIRKAAARSDAPQAEAHC